MRSIKVVIAALAVVCSLSANIGPPTVSYLYEGSPGDYTLDFTVDNNTNQQFYLFAVLLSSQNIVGDPNGWEPDLFSPTFNPSIFGGSNTTYNNVWSSFPANNGPAGSTVDGFQVTISDTVAPTSVSWLAATDDTVGGQPYVSGGSYGNDENPGFEGVTSGAAGSFSPSNPPPEATPDPRISFWVG